MTTFVMLDLETWGKRSGCDIRSIGACVFDPVTGLVAGYHDETTCHNKAGFPIDGSTFYVACDNPPCSIGGATVNGYTTENCPDRYRKYLLTRDPETVAWWNDQTAEAQAAFSDPVDLRDALIAFTDWFLSITPIVLQPGGINDGRNVVIYAHGPQFDISILEAAYHAVGLAVPWHYRAPRDTRTVFDLADVGDHSAWMQQFNHGTAHNALDDAIGQARAICAAWARVRGWRTAATSFRDLPDDDSPA